MDNTVYVPRKMNTIKVIDIKDNVHSPVILTDKDRFFYKNKQKKILDGLLKSDISLEMDLVHAHTLFTDGNLAKNLYEKYGVPYVISIRSTDLYFFKYRKFLLKNGIEILKNAKKIIFLSHMYKEDIINKYVPHKYKSLFKKKSVVIPNGIDNFWFDDQKEKKIKTELINIVYAGRIEKNKNLNTTLKAINLLNSKGTIKYKYTVVGDIKNKSEFKKLKKSNFVEYKGKVNKYELKNIFNKSHIYVMPSYYETFGLSYVEAMSQGLPIIYTRRQGFDGYFKNGKVGFSVSPNDHHEIAEKIENIIDNYGNFSNYAYEGANKFSWDVIGELYLELYKNINLD